MVVAFNVHLSLWGSHSAGMRKRTSVLLLGGCLGVLALLVREPLFEIGNTAITDRVFFWGVDGLSVWHPPLFSSVASTVQLVTFILTCSLTTIALLLRSGWRRRLVWFAATSAAVGGVIGCTQAWLLARGFEDIVPQLGLVTGPALAGYVLCLLVLHGIVEARLTRGTG